MLQRSPNAEGKGIEKKATENQNKARKSHVEFAGVGAGGIEALVVLLLAQPSSDISEVVPRHLGG